MGGITELAAKIVELLAENARLRAENLNFATDNASLLTRIRILEAEAVARSGLDAQSFVAARPVSD